MSITLKFYPKIKPKLTKITPIIKKDSQLDIISDNHFWLTGEFHNNNDLGFLFTDEGSLAFTMSDLKEGYIDLTNALLRQIGYTCFVGITVKVFFDTEQDLGTASKKVSEFSSKLKKWFKVSGFKYGLNNNKEQVVTYVEFELELENDCYLDKE